MEKPDLTKVHTRQLMAWRKRCYSNSGYLYGDHPYYYSKEQHLEEDEKYGIDNVTLEEILSELNKREHVPVGKEAKDVRRAKALAKRHRYAGSLVMPLVR